MNNIVLRNIFRFVILLLIQIYVCNYVHFLDFINPYIYILALLLLPLSIPKSLQYLIAFVTGLIVDIFAMTYGIHASASLTLIFLKPYVISWLTVGKNRDELTTIPIPGQKDFKWLLIYTFLMVFIHHFIVTMFELFTFRKFWLTLISVIGNSLFTTFIILCVQYIFTPTKKDYK